MSKSPAFQFYPGDWLRDDVSGCSLEAQGLWLRMMMIMHDSQIYGQLILNNEPMSPEFVAKKIGISPKKYLNLLKELDAAGVINRNEKGVIFSGRMERDEHKRRQNRLRQEKHREDDAESVTQDVTPLSRSSHAKSNVSVTRKSHGSSSSIFPFPSSFSLSDFKRLRDWAISENSKLDGRLVEIALIQTLINRNGSASESSSINSGKYFEPEIKKICNKSNGISVKTIGALLERRRVQLAEYEAKMRRDKH